MRSKHQSNAGFAVEDSPDQMLVSSIPGSITLDVQLMFRSYRFWREPALEMNIETIISKGPLPRYLFRYLAMRSQPEFPLRHQ